MNVICYYLSVEQCHLIIWIIGKSEEEERGVKMRPDTSNQKNIGIKKELNNYEEYIVLSRIIKVKAVQPRMITFMRP